jgi:hypothetical protein
MHILLIKLREKILDSSACGKEPYNILYILYGRSYGLKKFDFLNQYCIEESYQNTKIGHLLKKNGVKSLKQKYSRIRILFSYWEKVLIIDYQFMVFVTDSILFSHRDHQISIGKESLDRS